MTLSDVPEGALAHDAHATGTSPTMSDLTALDYGYSPYWEAHRGFVASTHETEVVAARVVGVSRHHVDVVTGPSAVPGRVRLDRPGHAVHDEQWPPVVGDWLALSPRGQDDSGPIVVAILPRRSLLERPSVGRASTDQAIAANVDVLALVEPVVPSPSVGRVEWTGRDASPVGDRGRP